MTTTLQHPTTATVGRYDAYEIHPCREYEQIGEDGTAWRFTEPCEAEEAQFWTLYGHIPGEGVEAIGDYRTREDAEAVLCRITGTTDGQSEGAVNLELLEVARGLLEVLTALPIPHWTRKAYDYFDKARTAIANATGAAP